MKRSLPFLAMAAAGLIPPDAVHAQADDPAVVSCEMLVREALPNTAAYRYVSGAIAGSVVTLDYEVRDGGGPSVRRQMRCSFTFSNTTSSWGFAPGLPEALSVAVMGALVHRGIYPIPKEATGLR